MLNEAISAIINLLKLKKDAKKTDLEIEKLERERKKEKSTINIASFDDIKKYDPRARNVFDTAERIQRSRNSIPCETQMHNYPKLSSRWPGLLWLIVIFIISYLVYKYVI